MPVNGVTREDCHPLRPQVCLYTCPPLWGTNRKHAVARCCMLGLRANIVQVVHFIGCYEYNCGMIRCHSMMAVFFLTKAINNKTCCDCKLVNFSALLFFFLIAFSALHSLLPFVLLASHFFLDQYYCLLPMLAYLRLYLLHAIRLFTHYLLDYYAVVCCCCCCYNYFSMLFALFGLLLFKQLK